LIADALAQSSHGGMRVTASRCEEPAARRGQQQQQRLLYKASLEHVPRAHPSPTPRPP
jgi:hypothetical protein